MQSKMIVTGLYTEILWNINKPVNCIKVFKMGMVMWKDFAWILFFL